MYTCAQKSSLIQSDILYQSMLLAETLLYIPQRSSVDIPDCSNKTRGKIEDSDINAVGVM